MKRGVIVVGAVFGVIGLGLLIGAFFALSSTLSFRSRSTAAGGVVEDLISSRGSSGNTLYKPVVQWTDAKGGKHRLTGSVASSPSSYSRGEKVTVRYLADNPEGARLDSFTENWLLTLVLGLIGTAFAASGVGVGAYAWRQIKNLEWLKAHGTRIQAKFTGVVNDPRTKVNGRSPWRLTAQWQDPSNGSIRTFQSDAIWYDPTEYVKRESLDVLVNPDKPSVYTVDVGFLPKHAD